MAFVCRVCIPNYYVMVRCDDIHLAKACQYAVLSLVGPSSSSSILGYVPGRQPGLAGWMSFEFLFVIHP